MIKVIAYITMLIDHVGLCFFPQCLWLRAIGRASMPIFSYGVAVGYHRTRQKGTTCQYLVRMIGFTLVSQIPYSMMLRTPWKINVGGTFVIALLLLIVFENCPSIYGVSLWPLPAAALLLLAALAHVEEDHLRSLPFCNATASLSGRGPHGEASLPVFHCIAPGHCSIRSRSTFWLFSLTRSFMFWAHRILLSGSRAESHIPSIQPTCYFFPYCE